MLVELMFVSFIVVPLPPLHHQESSDKITAKKTTQTHTKPIPTTSTNQLQTKTNDTIMKTNFMKDDQIVHQKEGATRKNFQDLWRNRHFIFHEVTSTKYQKEQERLLGLVQQEQDQLGTDDVIIGFRAAAKTHGWGTASREKNFAAIISARKTLGETTTAAQKCLLSLQAKASKRAARWNPNIEGQCITPAQMLKMWEKTTEPHSRWLRAVASVDLMIGHRVSDFAQILAENIFEDDDGEAFQIRVTTGKTIATTGPYIVNIPYGTRTSAAFEEVMNSKHPDSLYVMIRSSTILEANELSERASHLSALIREDIRKEIPHFTIRALRRGGLSGMGLVGTADSTIQTFGKHTSNTSQMRYMGDGRFSRALQQNQTETVRTMEAAAMATDKRLRFGTTNSQNRAGRPDFRASKNASAR